MTTIGVRRRTYCKMVKRELMDSTEADFIRPPWSSFPQNWPCCASKTQQTLSTFTTMWFADEQLTHKELFKTAAIPLCSPLTKAYIVYRYIWNRGTPRIRSISERSQVSRAVAFGPRQFKLQSLSSFRCFSAYTETTLWPFGKSPFFPQNSLLTCS